MSPPHTSGGPPVYSVLQKGLRPRDALSANEIAAQKGSLSKTYLGRELGAPILLRLVVQDHRLATVWDF